jgi:predicted nucleotide-binding protein
MAERFDGTLEELKHRIEMSSIGGGWEAEGPKHTFRSTDGGVLNWWESTGTLQIQGRPEASRRLKNAVVGESTSSVGVVVAATAKEQIFIVHGHDTEARDQLDLALRKLGLEPFILMNTSGGGKTIIEALEGQIGRDYSSDFGIVLLTPDDVGYSKKDGPDRAEPRARQNVILETGMLLSSLTRSRMAILIKGHLEMPSDLQGIIHFGYNDHVREIIPKLCQRLQEVGFQIDSDKIAAAAQ